MILPEWLVVLIISAQASFDVAILAWMLAHVNRHSKQYGPWFKGTD